MRSLTFLLVALLVGAIVFALALLTRNEYVLFAGFVVLQYIVLATAWNILGGYCGYVNFGTAAFFAMGAYYDRRPAQDRRQSGSLSSGNVRRIPDAAVPVVDPDPRRHRRPGFRAGRLRHGVSHAQAARGVLCHRHAGHGRRAADAGHQLGLRRRIARRLHHPAGLRFPSPASRSATSSTFSWSC